MLTILLLVIIGLLVFMLLSRRNNRTVNHREPFNDRSYPNEYSPNFGGGVGPLVGGFAAGALLSYLLESGRIDMGQFNYFNAMGDQQMMHELMQQNIIQQDEIDDLRHQMDAFGNSGVYDDRDPSQNRFDPPYNDVSNDQFFHDNFQNDNTDNNGDYNDNNDNWV